jgi:methylenetetrahydrofolate dehydrogenase (NADP+)/methenyltetrahydrofolate cyclohydrolase/formyltetrahydrofolate synthetase
MHGGGPEVTPGKALAEAYTKESLELLAEGIKNLERHIENAKKFGLKVIVGINHFLWVFIIITRYCPSPCCLLSFPGVYVLISNTISRSDTEAELELIRTRSLAAGADAAVVSSHWALGGKGAKALAEAVVAACESTDSPPQFKFLYELDLGISEKIESIAKEIYRADGIELSELAQSQVELYEKQGYRNLPSERYLFFLLFFLPCDPL